MPPFTPEDPQRIQNSLQHWFQWHKRRQLIYAADSIMPARMSRIWALGEIPEAYHEMVHSSPDPREIAKELADVLWFVLLYATSVKSDFRHQRPVELDPHDLQRGVNGSGGASNSIDVLNEMVGNMNPHSIQKDISHIGKHLSSLVNHYVPHPTSLWAALDATRKKNDRNRPAYYYQLPPGTKGDGHIMDRYHVTERTLRPLRGLSLPEKHASILRLAEMDPAVASILLASVAVSRVQ